MPRPNFPVLIAGRKGQRSIADSLASVLTPTTSRDEWPAFSFAKLAELVSQDQGYSVSGSTIRSTIYTHKNLFESVKVNGRIAWRLTASARKLVR